MLKTKTLSLAVVLVGLAVIFSAPARAELRPAGAEISRSSGQVEVMRKAQTQWTPAISGARLLEGDQIRALRGGSAELALPDGSTILVSENTRFAVTKLEYDAQTRERQVAFHLAAGKVRAEVARIAVQLVGARQSNFTISSPAGVAAVRGTIAVMAYNPETRQGLLYVLPSPGEPPSVARVTYVNLATKTTVTVSGNQYIQQTANQLPTAPAPISTLPPQVQQDIQTATNMATANSATLTAPTIVIVTPQQIQQTLQALGVQTVVAPPAPAPAPITTSPQSSSTSTLGRDLAVQQQCASPPCP